MALFSGFSPMCLCLSEFTLVLRGWAEHLQKGDLDLVFPGSPTGISQRMPSECMTAEPKANFGHHLMADGLFLSSSCPLEVGFLFRLLGIR